MDTVPQRAKRCRKCGDEKPLTTEHFARNKTASDGFQAYCKTCAKRWRDEHSTYNQQWLDAHPGYQEARYERYREQHPKPVSDIPEGMRRCPRCQLALPATPECFHRDKSDPSGVAGYCKICASEIMRAYRVAHPDAGRDQRKHYRDTHPEMMKERKKRYIETHLDHHREKARIHRAKRRALQASLPATFTSADWQHTLNHFGNCCAYCGRPRGLWHTLAQEHYIPASKGGGYTPDNIIPACHGVDGCNNSKCDRDAREWLTAKFGPRKGNAVADRIETWLNLHNLETEQKGELIDDRR